MLLIKTKRDEILAPLQAVCGIVEKRHTLPILSNVLIENADGALTFLATDIEIQIQSTALSTASGEKTAITVGARKLQEILRSLSENIDISLEIKEKRLQVIAGKSRFSLQTLPALDFPTFTHDANVQTRFQMTQKCFKQLLGKVQYAMAQQDIRYYLNGLLVVLQENEIRVVATDGHRLAFASESISENIPHTEFILPRKCVYELSRLLSETDDQIELSFSSNQAAFKFGQIELVSKLIDGKFPDYERVIPKNHNKVILLTRAMFLSSLHRAAILTYEKFRGIKFVLSHDSLKIISNNTDQEEAVEEIEIAYDAESFEVGFNVTYLLDVLNNLSSEEIELRLADANSSALFTLPGNDRFKYVVMPMRI